MLGISSGLSGVERAARRDGRRSGEERDRSSGRSGLDSAAMLGISSGLSGVKRAARRDGRRSGAERDRSSGRSGLDGAGMLGIPSGLSGLERAASSRSAGRFLFGRDAPAPKVLDTEPAFRLPPRA